MIRPCEHLVDGSGRCRRCGLDLDAAPIRVGDRVRLATLPKAGELPVIGLAGSGFVWVPNVDNIPFIASVNQVVAHLPRASSRGWYVTADAAEVRSFEYDVCHPLMSPDPPRDAIFFTSRSDALAFLLQRAEEEYRAAAAQAATARRRLTRLRESCAATHI